MRQFLVLRLVLVAEINSKTVSNNRAVEKVSLFKRVLNLVTFTVPSCS